MAPVPTSTRLPALLLVASLVAALTLAAGPASAATRYVDVMFDTTVESDVVYGQSLQWPTNQLVDLHLDVARPTGDAATDRPAIVWVHGGGFTAGDKSAGTGWIRALASRGYVAVSIDYRLRPGYYFDFANQGDPIAQGAVLDAVNDAQAAVRWVRAHAAELGVDPGRVAIAGSSAGGVTAAGVAMSSTQTGASGTPGASSRVCVAAALAGAYSPVAADPLDDRVVFFHGTADDRVPYQYAVATHDALTAQGVPSDLVTYPDVGHGLGMALVLPDLVPYLKTHLVDGPCTDPGQAPGGGYHPVTPRRVVDTRRGLGSPAAPLGPSSSRSFAIGDLPADAEAVAVNVTAVGATTATHLTVWPTGLAAPTASNLNLREGDTSARLVLTRLGPGDTISVQNRAGQTHVLVDVVGWFCAGGLGLHAGTPSRELDSRHDLGLDGPLAAGAPASLDVGDPGTVLALNTTATDATDATHLTVWPAATAMPATSTLNVEVGETEANLAFAEVGTGGVALATHRGTTEVVADRFGTFDPAPGGATFTPVWPTRVLDTRFRLGAPSAFGPGQIRSLALDGIAGLPPEGATAVALSVTIVAPATPTHLSLWPSGTTSARTSAVNAAAGATVPNLVVVALGDDGAVSLANEQGDTHVIVDVLGWFGDLSGVGLR